MTGYGRYIFTDLIKTWDNTETITVEILKEGYDFATRGAYITGEDVVLGPDPVIISTGAGNDSKEFPILGSSCAVTLLSKNPYEFQEFFQATDRQYLLKVLIDGVLTFTGWLIPEVYQEPYEPNQYLVRLTFTDGLADLGVEEFKSPTTLRPYNSAQQMATLVRDIMDSIGLEIGYEENIELVHDDHQAGVGDTTSALVRTLLPTNGYNNREDRLVFPDSRTVLEDILSGMVSRIFQSQGKWFIQFLPSITRSNLRRSWNESFGYIGNAQIDPIRDLENKDNPTNIYPIEVAGSIMVNNGFETIQVDYDYGKVDSFLRGNNFNDFDFDGVDSLLHWQHDGDSLNSLLIWAGLASVDRVEYEPGKFAVRIEGDATQRWNITSVALNAGFPTTGKIGFTIPSNNYNTNDKLFVFAPPIDENNDPDNPDFGPVDYIFNVDDRDTSLIITDRVDADGRVNAWQRWSRRIEAANCIWITAFGNNSIADFYPGTGSEDTTLKLEVEYFIETLDAADDDKKSLIMMSVHFEDQSGSNDRYANNLSLEVKEAGSTLGDEEKIGSGKEAFIVSDPDYNFIIWEEKNVRKWNSKTIEINTSGLTNGNPYRIVVSLAQCFGDDYTVTGLLVRKCWAYMEPKDRTGQGVQQYATALQDTKAPIKTVPITSGCFGVNQNIEFTSNRSWLRSDGTLESFTNVGTDWSDAITSGTYEELVENYFTAMYGAPSMKLSLRVKYTDLEFWHCINETFTFGRRFMITELTKNLQSKTANLVLLEHSPRKLVNQFTSDSSELTYAFECNQFTGPPSSMRALVNVANPYDAAADMVPASPGNNQQLQFANRSPFLRPNGYWQLQTNPTIWSGSTRIAFVFVFRHNTSENIIYLATNLVQNMGIRLNGNVVEFGNGSTWADTGARVPTDFTVMYCDLELVADTIRILVNDTDTANFVSYNYGTPTSWSGLEIMGGNYLPSSTQHRFFAMYVYTNLDLFGTPAEIAGLINEVRAKWEFAGEDYSLPFTPENTYPDKLRYSWNVALSNLVSLDGDVLQRIEEQYRVYDAGNAEMQQLTVLRKPIIAAKTIYYDDVASQQDFHEVENGSLSYNGDTAGEVTMVIAVGSPDSGAWGFTISDQSAATTHLFFGIDQDGVRNGSPVMRVRGGSVETIYEDRTYLKHEMTRWRVLTFKSDGTIWEGKTQLTVTGDALTQAWISAVSNLDTMAIAALITTNPSYKPMYFKSVELLQGLRTTSEFEQGIDYLMTQLFGSATPPCIGTLDWTPVYTFANSSSATYGDYIYTGRVDWNRQNANTLLMAADVGNTHYLQGDLHSIVVLKSTDGGASFPTELLVIQGGSNLSYTNPSFGYDSNGRGHVIYTRVDHSSGRRNKGLQAQYTDDDGASWSTPYDIDLDLLPEDPGLLNTNCDIIELINGDLICAYYIVKQNSFVGQPVELRLLRSRDGGATWSRDALIYQGIWNGSSNRAVNETSLKQLFTGEVVAVSRVNGQNFFMQFMSTDQAGTIWTNQGEFAFADEFYAPGNASSSYSNMPQINSFISEDGKRILCMGYFNRGVAKRQDELSQTQDSYMRFVLAEEKDIVTLGIRGWDAPSAIQAKLTTHNMNLGDGYLAFCFPNNNPTMVLRSFRDTFGDQTQSDVEFINYTFPNEFINALF